MTLEREAGKCSILSSTYYYWSNKMHFSGTGLGLESLCDRRWYCKLVFFYKILKGLAPSYLRSYLLLDNERT